MPRPVACSTYASDLGRSLGTGTWSRGAPQEVGWPHIPRSLSEGQWTSPKGPEDRQKPQDLSVNAPSRPITLRITAAGQHSDGLASSRHPQLLQVHGSHGGSGDQEPELLSRRSAFRAAVACPRPVPLACAPGSSRPRPGSAPSTTFD